MAASVLQCSDQHRCEVPLKEISLDQLRCFFAEPYRPMAALLHRKKLKHLANHRFLYSSRPYKILRYEIQPQVVLVVKSNTDRMEIEFESCEISGLGGFEKTVQFRCHATLTLAPLLVSADAVASLRLQKIGVASVIPDAMLLKIGRKALRLVFARLQDRCQRRLPRALHQWAQQDGKTNESSQIDV
ncbi:MAG: hypothetical protein CL862_11795 [Cyanobium sp. NAT70]|jgi:hypothetical protein|nr:hypothetical protein [Cyanobium sp. NAT70]